MDQDKVESDHFLIRCFFWFRKFQPKERKLEESYVKRDSAEVFNEYDTDKNKYLSFKETMEFAEVSEGTFKLLFLFYNVHIS